MKGVECILQIRQAKELIVNTLHQILYVNLIILE